MDRERGFPPSGETTPVETALLERIRRIREMSESRDARQEELLRLIAQPTMSGRPLTDAWLKLQNAQGELDRSVSDEIRERL
jgi:hypothetical protein